MKKSIAFLIGLSFVQPSFANPETPLDITASVLQALNGETAAPGADTQPAEEAPLDLTAATEETPALETAAEAPDAIGEAIKQLLQDESFNNLLHNDLREVAKFDEKVFDASGVEIRDHIKGTSSHILRHFQRNAFKFTGQDIAYYMDESDKDGGITALGPVGAVAVKDEDTGKNHFAISKERKNRRRNVVLSVSYERIHKPQADKSMYDMDLLVFFHSLNTGYVFRYINVTADWTNKMDGLMGVTVNRVIKEIPLSNTDFEVHAELASQKVILKDKVQGITKIIPITAGAIDSRDLESPTAVNSMTLLLPNTGSKIRYKDFELNESFLVKRAEWSSNTNSEFRTEPSYYKGRPFLGIVDTSLMKKNEDGTLATGRNGKPNYHTGYRQIGFHYQITDDGLKRGFESHGCMRMQDHDLYMVDAIVNAGPKTKVPIEVKMVLNQFQNLDSVYKRPHNYKKVVYTDTEDSPASVRCKNKPSYIVRYFTAQNGKRYHTLADVDCLTKTSKVDADLDHVVDVLTGKSNDYISTLVYSNMEHTPVKDRMEFFDQSIAYVNYLRPDSRYDYNYTRSLDQGAQIELQKEVERCIKDINCQNAAYYGTNTNTQNTGNNGGLFGGIFNQPQYTEKWPRQIGNLKFPRGYNRCKKRDVNNSRKTFNRSCASRFIGKRSGNKAELINNCRAHYDFLKQCGVQL